MEIWDAYLKDGTLAGVDMVRGEDIPQGLFHIVVNVIVKHLDGSYLLMKRDPNKLPFPGLYEAGAGGSILKGETPIIGAKRELFEETGVKIDELTFLCAVSNMKNAFYYTYMGVTDCEKDSVTLQEGETVAYRWVNRKEFLEFIESDEYIPSHRERIKLFIDVL